MNKHWKKLKYFNKACHRQISAQVNLNKSQKNHLEEVERKLDQAKRDEATVFLQRLRKWQNLK